MNSSDQIQWLACNETWTGPSIGAEAIWGQSATVGFAATVVAASVFGCTFVPFKFVNAGDGIFSQWVMCAAIFQFGLLIQLVRGVSQFYPLVVLSGCIWCLGNCCVVPIINFIGLALGMLIWNCTNVFLGWASGRFGFFGICPQIPKDPIMNYIGVFLCLASAVIYAFVKSQPGKMPAIFKHNRRNTGDDMAIEHESEKIELKEVSLRTGTADDQDDSIVKIPSTLRRIVGVFLALASGCCYGIQFVSTTYVMNHYIVDGKRASQNGLLISH